MEDHSNQVILDRDAGPTNANRRPPQHPLASQGNCQDAIAKLKRQIAEKKAQLQFLGWHRVHVSAICQVEVILETFISTINYGLYFGESLSNSWTPLFPKTGKPITFNIAQVVCGVDIFVALKALSTCGTAN